MQALVNPAALRHMSAAEATRLVALPPEGRDLLAQGMQPSLVHALYQPTDQAVIADRLLQQFARERRRDEAEVVKLFTRLSKEIDAKELKRSRALLYPKMTGGSRHAVSVERTGRLIDLIGARAEHWYDGWRTDGDMYAYLTQNAELVAWWLVNDQNPDKLDLDLYDYREALANQLLFWSATQRLLAKGF